MKRIFVLALAQRFHDSVDAVARQAENHSTPQAWSVSIRHPT